MSAYLLDNPGSPTEIPDELEAFLHVYVYGAMRRMNSNLLEIDGFMNTYFSGCEINDRRTPTCPPSKRLSVADICALRAGAREVVFSNPDGTVTKDFHVNRLISELLQRFHARYEVLKYEERVRKSQAQQSTAPCTPQRQKTVLETVPESSRERDDTTTGESDNDMEQDRPREGMAPMEMFKIQSRPSANSIPRPPQQVFDDAKLLTHAVISGLFFKFLRETNWQKETDVVPDRLNKSSALRKVLQSGDAETTHGPKPVTTSVEEEPDLHPPAEGLEAASVPVMDATVARPTKRRRKDPLPAPTEQPMAGPSTGRLTRSRSAAMAVAVPNTAVAQPPVATRVTRSQSGALPLHGGLASGASLGRTRSGTVRSNTLTRTTSGRGRGRAQARASTQAGPSNGGDGQAGSKDSKGKGVAGRSRRR